MKKQIFKGLLLGATLILVVWACTKDPNNNANPAIEDNSPQKLVFTDQQKDESRDFFAKILAKACKDEAVQAFLKEEALKKMNGDYEVLYEYVKNSKLSNGKTFAEVLQAQANKELKTRDSKTTEDFFKSFLEKIDPLLTIFLYAPDNKSVKDWNINTAKEVTLCLPSVDDEKQATLTTYKVDGSKGSVAVKVRPNDFYLVVRANERYKYRLRTTQSLTTRCAGITCDCPYTGDNYIIEPSNCEPTYGGGGPYYNPNKQTISFSSNLLGTRSGLLCPGGNSDRDRKTTNELCYQYTFDGEDALDAVEAWLRGSPEMYCIVEAISGSMGNTFLRVERFRLPEIDRSAYFDNNDNPIMVTTSTSAFAPNMESILWDKAQFGSLMKYSWKEEDGGPKIDFTAGLTRAFEIAGLKFGTNFGVTVKDITGEDDDEAGEKSINYCDSADGLGKNYTTGWISFSIKHQD